MMNPTENQQSVKQDDKQKFSQLQKAENYKEDLPQPKQQLNQEDTIMISKKKEIYDFVKIKVRLNEHYYVFSRFLISRMLMLCRIPKLQAEKISKDVKKYFIEQRKYEIEQKELETILFQNIIQDKFSQEYIERYQMTSEKRVPLIIFVFGAPSIGKSLIATNLAEKLNISNVLPTSIVKMTMNILDKNVFEDQHKMDFNEPNDETQFIRKYQQYAQKIKKGIISDITKTLVEGKPIIIEGYELIPDLYLKINRSKEEEERVASEKKEKAQIIENYIQNKEEIHKYISNLQNYNVSNHIKDFFFINVSGNGQNIEKDLTKQSQLEQITALIVPILLVINKRDHKYHIENYSSIQTIKDENVKQQTINNSQKNYIYIQNFLLKQSELCTVCPLNYHYPEETINIIHDIVLQKIENMYKNKMF